MNRSGLAPAADSEQACVEGLGAERHVWRSLQWKGVWEELGAGASSRSLCWHAQQNVSFLLVSLTNPGQSTPLLVVRSCCPPASSFIPSHAHFTLVATLFGKKVLWSLLCCPAAHLPVPAFLQWPQLLWWPFRAVLQATCHLHLDSHPRPLLV